MRRPIKLSAAITLILGTGLAVLAFLTAWVGTQAWASPQALSASSSEPNPTSPSLAKPASPTVPDGSVPKVMPTAEKPCLLDDRRRFALGMIETGNDDQEVGGMGEVSRFQIMPSVWRQYSASRRYHDPETSTEVARQHWNALRDSFRQQTHREPTDFDMYVLWNTRHGYYARHGFKPNRLDPAVRDRAERFVNLIQRGES